MFPANQQHIKIDDIEIKNGPLIPTYEMLHLIRKQYSDISFVIGSDLVESLESWEHGDRLKKEFSFIILNRGTSELQGIPKAAFPSHYKVIPEFEYGISSTEVRTRVKQSNSEYLDCMGMVAKSVLIYIIENKLYL